MACSSVPGGRGEGGGGGKGEGGKEGDMNGELSTV